MGHLEGIIALAEVGGRKSTEAPKETGVAYKDGPARDMAKGASMSQSGQLLHGRTAAHGAWQAGRSHGWTGFPRKSNLATVRKTSWREAKTGWQRGHLAIVTATQEEMMRL